jgi:phospholipase/carboxylesterase
VTASTLHHSIYQPASDATRTLLLMHGTGGDETSLLPLGAMLDARASILSVRGNVSEHGAARFFRRLREGVFDEADIVHRADEFSRWLDGTMRHHNIEPRSLVAVGYSNGANMAAAIMLLHPGLITRAILLRPMLPLRPDPLPSLAQHQALISLGTHDRITPPQSARDLASLLKHAGATIAINEDEGGHELTRDAIAASRVWLDHPQSTSL